MRLRTRPPLLTYLLVHGNRSPLVICPLVICTRVSSRVHSTTAFVEGSTQPAVICGRVYTLVHILAALVQGSTHGAVICTSS